MNQEMVSLHNKISNAALLSTIANSSKTSKQSKISELKTGLYFKIKDESRMEHYNYCEIMFSQQVKHFEVELITLKNKIANQ